MKTFQYLFLIPVINSDMVLIGFHSSAAGGVDKAVDRAKKLNADTFQIFLNSPRVWAYPPLTNLQIENFVQKIKMHRFDTKMVHLSYLPNLATFENTLQEKSYNSIKEAIKRCDILGINGLIIHIGSHKEKGITVGIKNVINMLDRVIELNPKVELLLETSSGSPKLVGNKFSELNEIIDGVSEPNKVMICFDTCHVFASGYDLHNKPDEIMDEFENLVGLSKIKAIHANDSKGEIGCQRDRHEHIGLGHIGLDGFSHILNHKSFQNTPFIIETPNNDTRGDLENMDILRSLLI